MRPLALLAAILLACAGDPLPLRDCTPGVTLPCACVGGASGAQLCDADGRVNACVCPDAGAADSAVDVLDASAPDVVTVDTPDVPDVPSVPIDVVDVQQPDVVTVDAPPIDACSSMTPANCCGTSCPMRPHASAATCTAGVCGIVCAAGFGDCDGNPTNGCEVDLATSVANCGACGAACRAAPTGDAAACASARCGLRCMRLYAADCDGDIANGCEVDLLTNRNHCGMCGGVCPPGRSCSGGGC